MVTHSLKHRGRTDLVLLWSSSPGPAIMDGLHRAGNWGVLLHLHHLLSLDNESNTKSCKIHLLTISTTSAYSHVHFHCSSQTAVFILGTGKYSHIYFNSVSLSIIKSLPTSSLPFLWKTPILTTSCQAPQNLTPDDISGLKTCKIVLTLCVPTRWDIFKSLTF